MAGRWGTAPFGAGKPFSGQVGWGAAVVVVGGGSGLSAALCGGSGEEQALRTSPAIPSEASAPQARRRARVLWGTRCVISPPGIVGSPRPKVVAPAIRVTERLRWSDGARDGRRPARVRS